MSDLPITLDVHEGVARLTLAAPERRNSVTPDFTAALHRHAAELAVRDDVRVVVLGAEGSVFSVGGDLDWMKQLAPGEVERALHAMAVELHAGMELLVELDAPVVGAVAGVAAGAGLSLLLACDIVVAAESSWFTVAYTAAGLCPDGGATWFLPRIVGMRKAAELMLLNDRLSAAEAAELQIVTRVVPDGALDEAVDALAARLASGPTRSYGQVKRLLRASGGRSLHDQFADEAATVARLGAGPEGTEGIAAFVERRPAAFATL